MNEPESRKDGAGSITRRLGTHPFRCFIAEWVG